ncbi:MAG: type II toxin-antitoxin system death-on-curing family toxin [Gemmatimonadota bacterium]|nr:type II toxin-antitoxin system death-on-curing family toxin [Gemmatimonadota bacterium]
MPGEGADHDRVVWLTVDEALAIHERSIEKFGGDTGLRDPGLLESALYRPRTGYYDDLPSMAAALFESLLKYHAFVDGNKRLAFFAIDVFLRLNGWKLRVKRDETYEFLVDHLSEGTLGYETILRWIHDHVVPLKDESGSPER